VPKNIDTGSTRSRCSICTAPAIGEIVPPSLVCRFEPRRAQCFILSSVGQPTKAPVTPPARRNLFVAGLISSKYPTAVL